MTPGILACFAAFFLFLVGQIALFQLFDIRRRFNALALLWLVLLAAYGYLYALFLHRLPSSLVLPGPVLSLPGIIAIANGVVIYLLMFLVYCCLYFTDHSLCVAFMIELESRPGRRMTREELKKRFPHYEMLQQRLADLIESGYVLREGEHYRLTSKGKLFAGTLGGMKYFLKLAPGG
jgi:hypothetical protein